MSEASMRECVEIIRDAVDAREDVAEMHTGPRSNELWFKLRDGREVRAAIQVIERLV